MYCPHCSQQQLSSEMRFCSQCGFSLAGVRELIARGGAIMPRENDKIESQRAVALRGARLGALLMLCSFPLLIPIGILTAIDDDFGVFFVVPVLLMIVGFFRMLFGVFVQGRTKRKTDSEERPVLPTTTFRTVQLKQNGAAQLPEGRQTSEVRQPASVTENTTRLLDDDVNPSN